MTRHFVPAAPWPGRATLAAALLIGCREPSSVHAPGSTLYVRPPPDGAWDDPVAMSGAATFAGIQAAVDAATPGTTVELPSGTWFEDVTMAEGVLVVGAGSDETWIVGTVTFPGITGAGLSRLSLYDPDAYASGTLYGNDGITVSGGEATIEDVGAYYFNFGIDVSGADTVTVEVPSLGGNWYGLVAEATTSLTVANGLVYSNAAGGIAVVGDTGAMIVHNTLVNNAFGGSSHYLSGALSMGPGGSEELHNNLVTSNYYGINCYSCGSSWSHNLVWGNSTDYVNDASAGSGDVSGDPLFVSPTEGDLSLKAASPCIDAGSATWGVATDANGEARPQGAGYDIGRDEYATSSYALVLSEVLANARVESRHEFVEIANLGGATVDLAGMVLTDGDDTDVLQSWDGGSAELAAGAYAVILDSEYDGEYAIDASVLLLTTADRNLGNGLTTSDKLTLYEADGSTVAASFSFPSDPGEATSMEMVDLETGNVAGNWRASQCAGGSSPGAAHCFPESGDPTDLVITEIMANPLDEYTGEYVEIYNPTAGDIDLAGLVFSDGASSDVLVAWAGGATLLGPGEHGLVIDSGYTYDYYLPTDVVLMTTGDASLGNGLNASSDAVFLYDVDGSTIIDTFSYPADHGNGVATEKIDYAAGDDAANWQAADLSCTRGASPARLNGAAGGTCDPLVVNEVMANADDEDSGEFVEIYNAGWDAVDLAGLVITDGDDVDTLQAFEGGSTVLDPGAFALIVDAEYDGVYAVDPGVVLVTTTDTDLGNTLAVSDELLLYEADAKHLIDAFLYPSNPGNAISIERVAMAGLLDADTNWAASTCASGSSPGAENCVSSSSGASSESSEAILITEVMSNPLTESTGEFVELYNAGSTDVDLLGWVLYDGDAVDTIEGYASFYDTVLGAGEYALVLDAGYAGDYGSLPSAALLLTTDDATLGSGLATSDPVYLFESNAISLVDSFTHPWDPGNGVSVERIDLGAGDEAGNWQASPCSSGSSPGLGSCP